jgi:hypothetical protein
MDSYFPERVLAIGCLRNLIASKLHSSPDELTNLRFIVNDEYMLITIRHVMPSWHFPRRFFNFKDKPWFRYGLRRKAQQRSRNKRSAPSCRQVERRPNAAERILR